MPTDRRTLARVLRVAEPEAWRGWTGRGIAATWVDATRVGVPSDFYYLAASGPLLSGLLHPPNAGPSRSDVLVDHVPAFPRGVAGSPGDYIARGQGTCTVRTASPVGVLRGRARVRPRPRARDPALGAVLVVAVLPTDGRRPHAPRCRHTCSGRRPVPAAAAGGRDRLSAVGPAL